MILSLSAIFWMLSVYLVLGTKLVKETLQALRLVGLVSGLTMCSWGNRGPTESGKLSWKIEDPWRMGNLNLHSDG